MQGILLFNTRCSYLTFVGMILLAAGLLIRRQFPAPYMICIIAGCCLFICFMDMDNWMMIGTLLIAVGLTPVVRRLFS